MTADAENLPTELPVSSGAAGWSHSAFFREHAPRLESLVRSRLSRQFQARFDAADIVQSAFRSFFLRPAAATSPASGDEDLWPLLAEIAVHKLAHQVRRHLAQRRTVRADVSSGDETVSASAGPDDAASLAEIVEMARISLDEPARTAFSLRLEGFEILEIAERLEISERTVRRHLSAAKVILKRLLDLEPAVPKSVTGSGGANSLPTTLRFDDYRLQQWIGDGAVGNVYRATEKSTGRTVAVKFIKKAFRFSSQAVASFRREIQIVSQLQHPGILQIIGLGQTLNQADFLIMDYAAGGDLAALASARRPTLSDIRRWALEVTDGLCHAHEHGVIHCDLKPSNVLLTATGRVQLCDFGLARQLVGWSDSSVAVGGTPAFVAPELIDPAFGPIGPWTDIFGLGAILWNVLTGRPVHGGSSVDNVLQSITDPAPIQWPSLPEYHIPAAWRSVIEQLLAKPVAARWSDMATVRAALQALPEAVGE